jgi:protein TonB
MSYQALLFCPDEKTARTVTQVLSELDFAVTPCTEPFAAVKQLMNERFDAVVVDCENEQNATLLFKSARNAPNNQSALAVAVVEGQAGVAKAFRIGANLVLTKPINVEQAKGTLRVARGLLRKGEGAKTAPAATSLTAKSTPPVAAAAPQHPAPQPAAPQPVIPNSKIESVPGPVAHAAVSATFQPPVQKPAPQPTAAASASADVLDDDSLEILGEESVPQPTAKPIQSAPKVVSTAASSGTGAASAAAPAREVKVTPEQKAFPASAEVTAPAKKTSEPVEKSAPVETTTPAAFSFGGVAASEAEAKQGGSKKAIIAVAAVVVIAAGAYGAWMQWGHSQGSMSAPAHIAAAPAPAPAALNAESSAALSVAAPTPTQPNNSSSTPEINERPKVSNDKPASGTKAKPHATVSDDDVESTAPAPSKKAEAKENAPIVIKANSGKASVANDAPAPSFTNIAAAGSGGSLPNLMGTGKAPTPTLQRLNISQGVSRGLLIKQVQPTYPPNALRLRIEGSVQMMATLSKNGDITEVKVLSGDQQLSQAAASAVKQWKYKPYLLNGEPVEIQTQITVNFKLPH